MHTYFADQGFKTGVDSIQVDLDAVLTPVDWFLKDTVFILKLDAVRGRALRSTLTQLQIFLEVDSPTGSVNIV